jgi:ribonuclease HI
MSSLPNEYTTTIIDVYVDGSYHPNLGKGGWGVY